MKHRGVKPPVVDQLQSVLQSFPLSEASLLANTGAWEQRELGNRVSQRFSSVFRRKDRLVLVSSSSPRAISSRKNFELGLSEGLGWNASSTYQQRDDLLRFFDACPRYLAEVKNNKSAFDEYRKFRSKMYPLIVRHIASYLSVDTFNISDGICFIKVFCIWLFSFNRRMLFFARYCTK